MAVAKLFAEIEAEFERDSGTVYRALIADEYAGVIGDLRREGYSVKCERKGKAYKIEVRILGLREIGALQGDLNMAESFSMVLKEIEQFGTHPFRYPFDDFDSLDNVFRRLRMKGHHVEIETRSPCDFTLVAWRSLEVYKAHKLKK